MNGNKAESTNEQLFGALYNKYMRLIYSVVTRRIDGREDVEDCLQDIFLYLIKHIDALESVESDSTKNYVATVANGFAITYYHRASRYSSQNISLDVCPEIAEMPNENGGELSDIIKRLPELDRVFVYLSYIYGYTSKEVGAMYGLKSSYIRKRLQIAKKNMREELKH